MIKYPDFGHEGLPGFDDMIYNFMMDCTFNNITIYAKLDTSAFKNLKKHVPIFSSNKLNALTYKRSTGA